MGMGKGPSLSSSRVVVSHPLLNSLLIFLLSSPFATTSPPPLSPSEQSIITTLTEEALKIPLSQFKGDEVLTLKYNSEVDSTEFWHEQNDLEPMYERFGKTSDKVLVLTKEEDKLSQGSLHATKQTYVVLRQKENEVYYPLFAYLRYARPNEKCPIERPCSNGNCPIAASATPSAKLCIEWDTWESRSLEDPTIWLGCSHQVLFSCGFNVSVFEKNPDFNAIMTSYPTITDSHAKTSLPLPEVDPFEELSSSNSTDYDFFDDLHGSPSKGGMKGRALSGTKKKEYPKLTPGSNGKMFDLCIEPSRTMGPNCFNGLGLSLDAEHPLQYALPSSSSLSISGPKGKKPNYRNYQPIGTTTMVPYVKGSMHGIFTPDDPEMEWARGTMHVFGPGSLDVFEAEVPLLFGYNFPNDQATVGTFTPKKAADANNFIHGVLIPLSKGTGYFIRSGLAYPSKFSGAPGTPITRGFTIPLENKMEDIFYPDSFIKNSLRLNNPLEKPTEGKISPVSHFKNDFPVKTGTLFPRKWVGSPFVRTEKVFGYAKWTALKGEVPPVRIAVVSGANGNPDEFLAVEEALVTPNNPAKNIAYLGMITYESDPTKQVEAYAVPSARQGEVDKYFASELFYIEPVMASNTVDVGALIKIEAGNKGKPIPVDKTVDIFLYDAELKPPKVTTCKITREDGSVVDGVLTIDKTVNSLKFMAKKEPETGRAAPTASSPVEESAPEKREPAKKLAPKTDEPADDKPKEGRYPTYKLIGSLPEPIKYHIGYETGTWKPDDKKLQPISVKLYILGMDQLDLIQTNKKIFGSLYPTDKGVAGTYIPTNSNSDHEIHGILIPIGEMTAAIFRDGLGYPASFKTKDQEILGFYAPSMRKQTEFFVPDSFINYKALALPNYVPIEGQILAEPHMQSEMPAMDGQLLPRGDFKMSIFIRGSVTKLQGEFKDADGKFAQPKILVIPGQGIKPDEFYPLDDTSLDTSLAVKGNANTNPATIERLATYIRSPSPATPDQFYPDVVYDVSPIKFHVLKRKMEPLTGSIAYMKGSKIPPRVPVDLIFDKEHGQPVPSRLAGNLETEDGQQIRGNIILNSIDGPFTFFPDVRDVPKEELSAGYQPGSAQKYNKMVPAAVAKEQEPKDYQKGATTGNFVPDSDNNGKPIRVVVHTANPNILDTVESEEPVFGRELPDNRGISGTYTPEDRRGKKKEPSHGILIPVDKNRAFFLRDGTGYFGTFTPKDTTDSPPIPGFIVPLKGPTDRFYFESYITIHPTTKKPTLEGKIDPNESVQPETSPQDVILVLKMSEPSIIVPAANPPQTLPFTPDDAAKKPSKALMVPGSNGHPDEFFPVDDDDDENPDNNDASEPIKGKIKTPTKDKPATLVPSNLPGASDEFILDDDDDADDSTKSDLVPVTITSTESDQNKIKAFARLPKGHSGPPLEPTPIFITVGIENVPTRLQSALTMPDDSTVVGLLVADSPTGPFTFFPGSANPVPSSLKLVPTYDDVITVEPTDDENITPDVLEEIKAPVPVDGHKGYPNYVPIGKSDKKIVMKMGVTLGNFVPDEENDGKPLRIAVHVVGPLQLDSVESEPPIFGQELPEDRGTEGVYTPDDKGRTSLGEPIRGILIPVDPHRAYFLRSGLGYEGKFTPKHDDPSTPPTPPTWGFVIPSQAGIRTADLFYPESFVTYNLKPKSLVNGDIDPDKKVQNTYKPRPAQLVIRRAEGNPLIYPDVSPLNGTFQDDAKKRTPRKILVVPENQGNPDEFYPYDDDDEEDEGSSPIKGTIKADDLEKGATLLPNPTLGGEDTFIPEDEGEPTPIEIESEEEPLSPPVEAYATLPHDHKPPLEKPTPITFTKGADQLPSRLKAKVTLPDEPPVEGLLVAETPSGPYTFFPGMINPEVTKPKPVQLISPEEKANKKPKAEAPKEEARAEDMPLAPAEPEKPKAPPTLLRPPGMDDGIDDDFEPEESEEDSPPPEKKCGEEGSDLPSFVQYGTSGEVVQYSIGVTAGIFSTPQGEKVVTALPVVVHVIGVDNLDVLESEDPIFGPDFLLPDSESTYGTYVPDNPKSNSISGVLVPVNSKRAYIIRDGTAYIATFQPENGGASKVKGFIAPSMIKNREAEFFYPQSFMCSINKEDGRVQPGEIVPDEKVEHFFPKAKGKLVVDPLGPSVFIPDGKKGVEGTFQDEGGVNQPVKVLVIPEQGRKPDEFYPVENVLQNGELTPGKVTTPDKEIKVTAVSRPSKQRPDLIFPEENVIELVTLMSKDRSIPKQKAAIVWKGVPKGLPKSSVKVVPLTKSLMLPFKAEVALMKDDGTFVNGLIAQNGEKDSYTFYPNMRDPTPPTASTDDGGRKPGDESKYPTYVQYGTSSDPIEYMTGITSGTVTPDDLSPSKSFPAVMAVEGIGKLDTVEFADPVFGIELPSDKGSPAIYQPKGKKGKPTPNPVHGILIPINEKTAYLIRDGLAYTAIFVPHKKKTDPIEGFVFQTFDETKKTVPFIPETFMVPSNAKGIVGGMLIPDAETAKFFKDIPGKLATNQKKPHTFIPSELKTVPGEFQDKDKKYPPKKMLVAPGGDGHPDEFFPDEDDILSEDVDDPVKGTVTTSDKTYPIVAIPNNSPGARDTFLPDEDEDDDDTNDVDPKSRVKIAPVSLFAQDEGDSAAPVKATLVRPKNEKGRPKKPVDLVINDPEAVKKLAPRTEVILELDDGTKVPGLVVVVPEDGSVTFYPGAQNVSPTEVNEPEKDEEVKPTTAGAPTEEEPGAEDDDDEIEPEETKYPTYVQYGTSADPIEYKLGGTVGTFTPEESSQTPLPATVFVFGVDKLDIIQFDKPVFPDFLPEDMATVGTYTPADPAQNPIRGVVIPIDERTGYIVRDGLAFTSAFHPKTTEDAPLKIYGFSLKPLSGNEETERFVAESYVVWRTPLSKQNLLEGTRVPSKEGSVFFPQSKGKLLTRGYGPSIFIPDGIELLPGTFQDDELAHPPTKVHLNQGKDGKPDEVYPDEDEITGDEISKKGSVTTPWKMIPVAVIPSQTPQIPAKIVKTDENEPELVTFEKTPGPVKAYLIRPKGQKGLPRKATDVVLTKPEEDPSLPISQDANLILKDGTNRTGLLVTKAPGGVDAVFFPGMEQPKKPEPKPIEEPPPKKPKKIDDTTRPKRSGMYPTYNPHTSDGGPLEYFVGTTEGTFTPDDDPTQSFPFNLNVLGADKVDILVSPQPIFGGKLPDDTGTAGTFKPGNNPSTKNPQRAIHGVILPVDEKTAFVIRDGLAYPVTLYTPDEIVPETHGFFVPLVKKPIELFYPDSIKAFEPLVATATQTAPNNLIPAEIVPDEEIDPSTFPDSKGKIVLNRKSPNRFISEHHPEKVEEFNDDDGKVKIPFQVAESDGLPEEFIDIDKNLPPVVGVARGNLVDQKEGAKDPSPRRAAVLSLPKINEEDPVEFEVYPEDKFDVREIQVTSRNKKLKNVEGYAISPVANKGAEGKPMDIIFKVVKPSIDEPKHSVTVTFIDDESVVRGNLFVNHVSGPHSFYPAGGRMTYAAREPTFELGGTKPKSTSPAKETPPPTAGSPKEDENTAKSDEKAKPKEPAAAPKEKLKPKTPTPIFADENDDEWPFNEVYEPTEEDNKDPAGPDSPPPKKPEKAIQAIIVPLDLTDKTLYAVKGKIPTSNPVRGKPMSFIPYRSEEAKMNYFRGTLKMPGNPEELEGRFRAPKRPSTPPVFIADPEGSDPAVFIANNNPRMVVYGYVVVNGDDFLFQPDEPNILPSEPTPGVIKITGKQNKVGILMRPTATEKPYEFRTSGSPKKAKLATNQGTPVDVDFYPDSDEVQPIKGKLEISGDKKTFTPTADPVDSALLPLHGLVVSPTDVIPSQFGFLYPTASEGAPLEFRNDEPKTVLAEFRPDNAPDVEIKGVFIPSKSKSENAGQFIPSNGKMKIPYNQMGTLDKKTSQDLPAVGIITEKDGQGYFTEDNRPTFDASFHPDVEGSEPIDGMFVLMKGDLPAEFRPTLGVAIKFALPSPGQIMPKVDTQHQLHGTLKANPSSTLYFIFEEDPPDEEPTEGQVDLKARKEGEEEEPDDDESFNVTQIIYIWGAYFTGTGGAFIFIPRGGTTGHLVTNERPPTDPNAIKFEGSLAYHPVKKAPSGEDYYATFTPNHNGRENNLPGDFVSGMPVVFYPAGAISVGVIGKLIQIDENEWIIIVTTVPKPGRWRPPPGVTQFTYDDSAQIVPYDANMIWFRTQERDKMAGVKVKGGYYKGVAGVMVIVPEAYKSGAMYVISGENKIHGRVYPINKGKALKFLPDDEPTAYMKVKEAGNRLMGELDLDESLSVNGKTPDNGIPTSMSLNDQDEFIIVPNEKGQWGYFIPGRKPLPSLVVMVFGGSSSGGPSGRRFKTAEEAEECSHLKNTYYLHEEDRYVLQACLRTVSSENQEKQGFHPYSEVDGDDADEGEEAKGGIAHAMNTGANLFISSGGVAGEFLVLEHGRASINLDSLSRIPGKLVYMPDPQRLLFKPDDLSVLLEEIKGTGVVGIKGFFQSKLGIKKEGMLYGTLKLNPKGVSGILSVEKPGKFGIIYVTGNEPVVAGTQMRGRTMGDGEMEGAVMSAHGILYETGGTGTFLEGDVDVGTTFMFEKGDGKPCNQSLILSPELGLVYSASSLLPEFKAAVKVRKRLGGKLFVPEKDSSIPATLMKSRKFPMAYHFAPNVPFRTGWMAERKGDEGEEVLFINDDSIDVFQHPGWKTQYLGIEPGVTEAYEKLLFHGLGNCPSDPRTGKEEYKKALDNDDKLIRFFLKVLRTQCLKKHFDKVKKLVDSGILEIAQEENGKVLKMKKDNKLLTAVKLTKPETEDISAAFSMAVLSQTFVEQLFQQNQTFTETDVDGNPISRSAYFFQKMVMMAVVKSKEVLKRHFVLMMRNLITTLNTAMVKLDQDRDRIGGCNGCEKDLVTIINDRKHLTALRQFITHNVRYVNDKDPEKRFRKYCKANKIYISKLATKKIRLSNNN